MKILYLRNKVIKQEDEILITQSSLYVIYIILLTLHTCHSVWTEFTKTQGWRDFSK